MWSAPLGKGAREGITTEEGREKGVENSVGYQRETAGVCKSQHKILYIFIFLSLLKFFLLPRLIFQPVPLVLHFRHIIGQVSYSGWT